MHEFDRDVFLQVIPLPSSEIGVSGQVYGSDPRRELKSEIGQSRVDPAPVARTRSGATASGGVRSL